MKTVTTSPISYDGVIEIGEAKTHLNEDRQDRDQQVAAALRAAVDWAENRTSRTLRAHVERESVAKCWGDLVGKALPFQPVIELTGLSYFDTSDTEQEIDADNYRLIRSTGGASFIEFADGFTRPALACRSDAVKAVYTNGYADPKEMPPLAIAAIKLMMTVFYGDMAGNEVKQWEDRAEKCLDQIQWSFL